MTSPVPADVRRHRQSKPTIKPVAELRSGRLALSSDRRYAQVDRESGVGKPAHIFCRLTAHWAAQALDRGYKWSRRDLAITPRPASIGFAQELGRGVRGIVRP